jgi:hypothetical protein
MPRKRPGTLRRSRQPKACRHDVPHVPGLDGHSQYEIGKIEPKTAHDWARQGLWPGATTEALTSWRTISRRPSTRVFLPCCCGRHPRAVLEEVLDALTTPTARALTKLIGELDDEFHRRTVPDPHLPSTLPWWDQRCPL